LYSIEIPYDKIFGYPWEFKQVEYWWEITFFVFDGNPYSFKDNMDYKKWGRYSGCYYGKEGSTLTFEDMTINSAKCVKEEYGDFRSHDFMTKEELENHEKNTCFNPCGNTLKFNKKHVDINLGLMNLRWLDWYIKNKTEEVIIKDWEECTLEKWKSNIKKIDDLMPKYRKKILGV
jgi:hypothetical protein